MRTVLKTGEIEKSMTVLLQSFRWKTDGLCALQSECNEASKMITVLNNIGMDVYPLVRTYCGDDRNPTLNDRN